jgi:hypothetical protein
MIIPTGHVVFDLNNNYIRIKRTIINLIDMNPQYSLLPKKQPPVTGQTVAFFS